MAGGSTRQKVIGEDSVLEQALAMVGEETRFEKGSELGTGAILNFDSSYISPMEASNQKLQIGA